MTRFTCVSLLGVALLAGCGGPPKSSDGDGRRDGGKSAAADDAAALTPLAYIDGRAVNWRDLSPGLLEAVGGQVLAEVALDMALQRRIQETGIQVGAEQARAERELLAAALARSVTPDANQAERLLQELRRRIGPTRFDLLLWRNAALRALVQPQVQVSEAALRQRFELEHGRRFEARLVVVGDLPAAAKVVERARAGESFVDLAIALSQDSSRAQAGLLPPVSPADATFPAAVRNTLARMEPGQVSDPVALEQGFAVLRLERIIAGDGTDFAAAKQALEPVVRRDAERLLMQQMAQTLLRESDVVVLDPALKWSWDQRRQSALEGP